MVCQPIKDEDDRYFYVPIGDICAVVNDNTIAALLGDMFYWHPGGLTVLISDVNAQIVLINAY